MSDPTVVQPYGIERRAFDPDLIHPSTLASNDALRRYLDSSAPLSSMSAEQHRAREKAGESPFAACSDSADAESFSIDGDGGKIGIRAFRAVHGRGVYLHFHGGGWVLGGAAMQDAQLRQLAQASGMTVVSVEYRLAPEHPYPAAPDDCERAAVWLQRYGAELFGAEGFCLGGESAGAHLALVTALRLRDRDCMSGLRGLNLVSGIYNLAVRTMQPGSELTDANWGWFLDQFCPEKSRRHEPDISPLWACLEGLPRTLLTVGSLDPCVEDTAGMYARMLAAGVAASIEVWPGGMHAFASLPGLLYEKTQEHQAKFLRDCFKGAVASGEFESV